jgi:ferredoxin
MTNLQPLRCLISIDLQRCIGQGTCAALAGKTFFHNLEENIAEVIDPNGDPPEAILEAAKACPTQAIYLDTREGQPVWPPD